MHVEFHFEVNIDVVLVNKDPPLRVNERSTLHVYNKVP